MKSLCRVDSSRSHGLQPTRLLRPWDFPGKRTGLGCHCLLRYFCLFNSYSLTTCPLTWGIFQCLGGKDSEQNPSEVFIQMGVFKRGKFWRGSEDGGFLNGSVVKNPPAIARDEALIPGWGRSLGGGNGNPLQYSCWEGSTDREAWWATVHGVTKILFVTQ